MELYLAVRGSQEKKARLFPLIPGRTCRAGRYFHRGGPLVDGRYLNTQGPLLDKDEYIPLELHSAINRYHFEAGWDEAGPWVRDLTSRNGTRLNGIDLQPYERHPLQLDDELRVAGCVIRVVGTAPVEPAWLAWNDGTVRKIAQAISDERAFDRIPILADALEDAGCNNADILNHCREPGIHVRGCWVIDLLLGQS